MPGRKAIGSVLHNFLGTYTSRYSDHDGYRLFGVMALAWQDMSIDLLGGAGPAERPLEVVARGLGCTKFEQVLARAAVPRPALSEARHGICQSAAARVEVGEDFKRESHDLVFTARVVTADGRPLERCQAIFAAPHDPRLERRSGRAYRVGHA